VAAALTLPACSSGAADGRTLTVSAAASLTEAFTDLAATFEEEHPDVTVALNFAGSSALAEQVNAGAPVDVLATASATTMATAADAGSVVDPKAFAANRLAIVVPAGNPSGVTSLADLSAVDVQTAICAAEVPCGAATDELLRRNGIQVNAVTLDPDVKSVLGRVAAGEVDAGIVYVTDASAAEPDVEPVPLPDDGNVSTDYLIARVAESGQPELAADFIDLVTGPTGQRTLADRGFTVR
jgi:molybdate transport system substrate-binding protein